MAAIVPDPKRTRAFRSKAAFEAWMARNHALEPELWLKIHKKASGLPSITAAEALEVALCWGWIDAIRKAFDERSFLQRYTPRKARSIWSQINRDHVARLTAAGRMTPHGQRHVDAAKADGRWDAAYAPARSATHATVPADLRAAIEANPAARQTFQTLNRQNLFSLIFRTNNMKTAAGRAKKIAQLVALLARGETLVPQGSPRANKSSRCAAPFPPLPPVPPAPDSPPAPAPAPPVWSPKSAAGRRPAEGGGARCLSHRCDGEFGRPPLRWAACARAMPRLRWTCAASACAVKRPSRHVHREEQDAPEDEP